MVGDVGEHAGLALEGLDYGLDALLGTDLVSGEGEVFYPSVLEGMFLLYGAEIISYLLFVPGAGLELLEVV